MNIKQLVAMRMILATGTMTKAAQVLHMSQPTVSSLIASLEQEIGFKLFRREGAKLSPTVEAKAFSEEAQLAIQSMDQVKAAALSIRNLKSGVLRIAAQSWIGSDFVCEIVGAFCRSRPNVEVSLSMVGASAGHEAIMASRADVLICEATIDHPLINYSDHLLECVCILPPDHSLATQKIIYPAMLSDIDQIALPPTFDLTKHINNSLFQAKVRTGKTTLVDNVSAICSLVASGVGFGIVDRVSAKHFSISVTAREFRPKIGLRLGTMHRADQPLAAAAGDFIRFFDRSLVALDESVAVPRSGLAASQELRGEMPSSRL